MICLNPIYHGKKYLKGYLRLENSDFFKVDTLSVKFIFDAKNSISSKIKFNYLMNVFKELPDYIVNQLVKYNVKVIFIDNEKMVSLIGEDIGHTDILGLFINNGSNKSIYINSNQPLYSLRNSLYHEIGHFIDSCLGIMFSKTNLNSFSDEELEEYFKRERFAFENLYFRVDIAEYFAQIFSEMMQDNKELISFAPKSCNHIAKQIRELKKAV